MHDLVRAMGINRGSLYDTFGDKRSLFLEAIAHYDETIISKIVARLTPSGSAKQAIVDYFREMLDGAQSDQRAYLQQWGCLLTNSIVELSPHDAEAAERFAMNLHRIEEAFYRALITAQDQGELAATQDAQAIARFLVATLLGLRVLCKSNSQAAILEDVVNTALSVLE